jgi:hypothetical protein
MKNSWLKNIGIMGVSLTLLFFVQSGALAQMHEGMHFRGEGFSHHEGFHHDFDRDFDHHRSFFIFYDYPYYYYPYYPYYPYGYYNYQQQNPAQNNPASLSVMDIANMASKGVPDDEMINEIKRTNSAFHLNSELITYLKQNGVSDKVIDYMLSTGSPAQY